MPGVPYTPDEMALLRLATRSSVVSRAQLRRVHEWLNWGLGSVSTRMTCCAGPISGTVASRWLSSRPGAALPAPGRLQAGSLPAAPWPGTATKSFRWSMASTSGTRGRRCRAACTNKLRGLCQAASAPSRFFSVRRNGRRHATLELVHNLSNPGRPGLEKVDERWRLQDCRLSHNRLPPEDLVRLLTDFARHYSDQACASPFGYAHTPQLELRRPQNH